MFDLILPSLDFRRPCSQRASWHSAYAADIAAAMSLPEPPLPVLRPRGRCLGSCSADAFVKSKGSRIPPLEVEWSYDQLRERAWP